jgi:hypothetical protein
MSYSKLKNVIVFELFICFILEIYKEGPQCADHHDLSAWIGM